MVAISQLNLPEPDRAALDASLWAWSAAGIDAALTTWGEVLARIGTPPADGPVTDLAATGQDVLPPAGSVIDPYGLGASSAPPSGVEAVTIVPGLRRIECLVGDDVDYESLWKSLRSLTSAEWTACVLTGLNRMPAAHEQLRGTPVRVQGWWRDENRDVHFTADQVC